MVETKVPIHPPAGWSADVHGSHFLTHASCERKDLSCRIAPINFREYVAPVKELDVALVAWNFPDTCDAPAGPERQALCWLLSSWQQPHGRLRKKSIQFGLRNAVRSEAVCPFNIRDVD